MAYIIEPTFAILTETAFFIAVTFLPGNSTRIDLFSSIISVVLEEDQVKSRISTEKNFKAIRNSDIK